MALKQRLTMLLALLAVVSATVLADAAWRIWHVYRYNTAVSAGRYAQAAPYAGDHGVFAKAFAAQRAGQYQDARVLYAQLERCEDAALRSAVLFNMGNTYLEQAAQVDMAADADLALPLIELAKVSYRDLLKRDPGHWDAKFNLERALRLLPDSREQTLLELEGRSSPVRTVISAESEDNLP